MWTNIVVQDRPQIMWTNIVEQDRSQIMWTNIVEQDRPEITIWPMRIACWIPKVADTLSQYVILLFHGNNGFANVPQYVHTYNACVFFYI
jgi:hypothetical protein